MQTHDLNVGAAWEIKACSLELRRGNEKFRMSSGMFDATASEAGGPVGDTQRYISVMAGYNGILL